MNDLRAKISESIADSICKELATKTPYISTLNFLQSKRETEVKEKCIKFANKTIDDIN